MEVWKKKLKKKTDVKILAFDDTYKKHYCDIVLNHNIGADKKRYKNLVPKKCEIRCGVKYTLLRDEFIKEREKIRVFIAMGGADHSNLNIKILKTLKKFNNIEAYVVTTKANKNLIKLEKFVKNKSWISLYINSNQIAKLMKQSDFAIITPSVILNEVYFMKLPFIAIKTANNQKNIYSYLKKKRFLTLKKFSKVKLQHYIKTLISGINR